MRLQPIFVIAVFCFLATDLSLATPFEPCRERFEVIRGNRTFQRILKNPSGTDFRAEAYITSSGILNILIVTRDENGNLISSKSGTDIYREIMAQFGASANGVVGRWNWGTNLAEVNRLTAPPISASLDEAVKKTWAARALEKYGLTRVEVAEAFGQPGAYSGVIVLFTRQDSNLHWSDIPQSERM